MLYLLYVRLSHSGKVLHCLCEIRDGSVSSSMLNALANTMVQVPFQNDLTDLVQRALCGVDLNQDILAGHIFIDHCVYGVQLSHDFFHSTVYVFRIHALAHKYLV